MIRLTLRILSLLSIACLLVVLAAWADCVAFDAHGMVGVTFRKPAALMRYEGGALSLEWWNTSPWLQSPPAGRGGTYLNLRNALVWHWEFETTSSGFFVRCPLWFAAVVFSVLPGLRASRSRRRRRKTKPERENAHGEAAE